MSHNSYELRKQKIESDTSETFLKLRSERHFSIEDLENARNERLPLDNPVFFIGLGIGIMITLIICHFIK